MQYERGNIKLLRCIVYKENPCTVYVHENERDCTDVNSSYSLHKENPCTVYVHENERDCTDVNSSYSLHKKNPCTVYVHGNERDCTDVTLVTLYLKRIPVQCTYIRMKGTIQT